MRGLAILLFILLSFSALNSQSADRIELDREIEYFRNAKPDDPVPDICLIPLYPPLPVSVSYQPEAGLTLPGEVNTPDSAEPENTFLLSGVDADTREDPFLPVPTISTRSRYSPALKLLLQGGGNTGLYLAAEYNCSPFSTFAFAGQYDWEERSPVWIWGRGSYSNNLEMELFGAARTGDSPFYYALARGGLKNNEFSLFVQQSTKYGAVIRPKLNTALLFTSVPLDPVLGIETDGLLSVDDRCFRIRPFAGLSGGGYLTSQTVWRGEGQIMAEYSSQSDEFSFFTDLQLSLVTAKDVSFFLSMKRGELDDEKRVRTGLLFSDARNLLALSGWQEISAGVSGQARSWDYGITGGFRWGRFLRYREEDFKVLEDSVPFGDLQFRFKRFAFAVTDISFYAEYLNNRDWQFRLENSWDISRIPWKLGVRAGNYCPLDDKLSSLVQTEDLLVGVFAGLKGKGNWRFEWFTHYIPADTELVGGVLLRLSF